MKVRKFVSFSLIMGVILLGAIMLAGNDGLRAETSARQAAVASAAVSAPAGAQAAIGNPITASADAGERMVVESVASPPLSEMPVGEYNYNNDQYRRWQNGEIDIEFDGIPPAQLPALWAEAMQLASAPAGSPAVMAPTLLGGFDSIDSNNCCGGGNLTPPDPEMAAGPNHLIAVVNVAIEIYDKTGTSLAGPVTFSSFFAPLGGPCQSFPFDPNVLYDESADRFIIAADGDGDNYCVGVSQTSNPVGSYFLYAFPTSVGGQLFDYPHAGIGRDALYMGANMFGSGQGYVYAMDKAAMYVGGGAALVTRVLPGGFHTTPQPVNLHGWNQGTWPTSGPHYFVAGTGFSNAATYQFYTWNDPFGANVLTNVTSFNFPAIHGVAVGTPINSPQMGGSSITANDPRPLDFEYRNGSGWTAMSVSCNPGGVTVNCIQWAEINLAAATVAQTDVYRTTNQFRYFPDVAVDHCDQALVGYTKSNSTSFPGVSAAGPLTAGSTPGETLIKAGDTSHYTFTNRWGDYTGMTIDPDGTTFWYLGEYSKNNGNPLVNWGNWIGELTLDCQTGGLNATVYVSADTAGTTNNGIVYGPEDILAYDGNTGVWSLYFDGSANGLSNTNIDAFLIYPNGRIFMSFAVTTAIPGFGFPARPEDLAIFLPNGNWRLFFDGSDVGLFGNNVDGLGIAAGRLVMSTSNPFGGFAPEDVVIFNHVSFGGNTSGTWTMGWDGSAHGFGASQTDALWKGPGQLLNLSTATAFGGFDLDDIYDNGMNLFLDAQGAGLGSSGVDGLHIMLGGPQPDNSLEGINLDDWD